MIGRLVASFPPGKGGLSASEVDTLVAALDQAKMQQGRVASAQPNRQVVNQIRSGSVQWVGPHEVGDEIFSHFFTLALVTSRERGWGFDIKGITPFLQATQYSGEGRQHYSWHMDWGLGGTGRRKVGVVAHLSDEADFEGGKLQLTNGSTPVQAVQTRGTVTVFPAFLLHRVTPVTKGVRLGAVGWALGPSFR